MTDQHLTPEQRRIQHTAERSAQMIEEKLLDAVAPSAITVLTGYFMISVLPLTAITITRAVGGNWLFAFTAAFWAGSIGGAVFIRRRMKGVNAIAESIRRQADA